MKLFYSSSCLHFVLVFENRKNNKFNSQNYLYLGKEKIQLPRFNSPDSGEVFLLMKHFVVAIVSVKGCHD